MPSNDLATLEKLRRALSDTIARTRPATAEEETLKDELVAKRDAVAAEKDRLVECRFEGSIQGLDSAWAELQAACNRLKEATNRIATTKKVIEISGRVLALVAKAAPKISGLS
jgi:hypothetical protein